MAAESKIQACIAGTIRIVNTGNTTVKVESTEVSPGESVEYTVFKGVLFSGEAAPGERQFDVQVLDPVVPVVVVAG